MGATTAEQQSSDSELLADAYSHGPYHESRPGEMWPEVARLLGDAITVLVHPVLWSVSNDFSDDRFCEMFEVLYKWQTSRLRSFSEVTEVLDEISVAIDKNGDPDAKAQFTILDSGIRMKAGLHPLAHMIS